jgi:glyoxylase-like metal-dependent hydrolase (beta-lactamase superfamily II)
VKVDELAPGLWRWTALHPDWTPEEDWEQEVGCVYYEAPDAVVLIDPLVPPEDADRFWRALDRDLERAGRAPDVLLTVFWHARSAQAILDRYAGARVWAHERGVELVRERTAVTDVFRAGDTLPGGVVALDANPVKEIVFWIAEHRTLVAGDVLLGREDGLATPLAAVPRALLDLPVERVLPGHGAPVLSGGREALAAALTER